MPRSWLALLLLLGACTGPVRSANVYESKAGVTAETMASAVETARLAVQAVQDGDAYGRYLTQVLAEAEEDADAAQGTFEGIQPPDRRADELRDRLDGLLGQATDTLGTLAIGALLAVVAVVLGFEMYSLLLGEAASPEEQATIRDTLAATPGIAHLLQLRTMHLAPEELVVAARFELDHDLSGDDAARVIDQAQAQVRQAVPSARIIYLEPELPTAEVPQPGRRSQR